MIDTATLVKIRAFQLRRSDCLAQIPPDREMAEIILGYIDKLLDERPRPIAVAPDGEIVMSDQSPWIAEQVAAGGTRERLEEDKS